ncbi:MAG: fumarylacetoacetate hydrolase family protein [Steroidobacteraceae bacterium]|jgi:fumarylpyruvate hydrolase
MEYVLTPPRITSAPVAGTARRFPVHRIYCVGSNYRAHAQEMGRTGGEPPVFFMKPADALLPVESGEVGRLPYPSLTHDFHHEVELVVAIGEGGCDIPPAEAQRHVYGYAVGLDMTRRDLQAQMKKRAGPWCIGKGFEYAAPIGPVTAQAQAAQIGAAVIALSVNGLERQRGAIAEMIWSVPQIIAQLSAAWTLAPGDLVFTGTPAGVAAVERGDLLEASVTGLEPLRVRVA